MSETVETPRRTSGILLHPTSLPGPWGIGDIGPAAHTFVDELHAAGQRVWQVLPLGPTDGSASPYSSYSSLAGNPLLISPDALVDEGLLENADPGADPAVKHHLLEAAHENAMRSPAIADAFDAFREREAAWLDDFALFTALKEENDERAWFSWDDDLRRRAPAALDRARRDLAPRIALHAFAQFVFFRQWSALREHAASRDVSIVGDIPFYVAHDSVDVWTDPSCFALDADLQPSFVAGVPPDYFSETGQRWGNPVFDWDRLRDRGYDWWTARISHLLRFVDVVRIDHFRGFEAYWRIPAGEETAVNGEWITGPGEALFDALAEALGPLPIWAEDLGEITPEVHALRRALGFPGMKILQFAFSDPQNTYLPFHHDRNCVVYTGTHDNDTTLGWWAALGDEERGHVRRYFHGFDEAQVHWHLIRMAMNSVADHVVIPLQDVLGLGSDARMNVPGVADGNWTWRYSPEALTDDVIGHLRELTGAHDRLPPA